MIVKVDSREDNSGVGAILAQKYKFEVVKENLRVGDYLLDDIVIERKTSLDFVQSIIDGRLFKQAANMRKFFNSAFFVIEGDNLCDTKINIHPHAVKGALISLILQWQMPVLFSKDAEETALLLWLFAYQKVRISTELPIRHGRRPKLFYRRQLYILQGLPNIGPKLAAILLRHFGTIEATITASENLLTQVAGIGKIKAQKIRQIVSARF